MLRIPAIISLSLAAAAPCFAWGGDGHRIVATIATSYLTEDVAKQVHDLLGDQTVADAATWADDMRSDPKYDWIKPYHYIDLPRNAQSVDMKRDGAEGKQVISGILKYREVLRDTSRPKEERLEALRLLFHFVGDVHQPFHVSYTDDKGGNMLSVLAWGKKSNMHRVFDSDLISRRLKDTKGGWATMSADLRNAITDAQRKQWSSAADPVIWANESFSITRQAYSKAPNARTGVDDAYWKEWMPTVNLRLEMAGVRLAALLNDALKAPGSSGSPAAGGAKKPATKQSTQKQPTEKQPTEKQPTQPEVSPSAPAVPPPSKDPAPSTP
jgi:S1/P1 Nuclease